MSLFMAQLFVIRDLGGEREHQKSSRSQWRDLGERGAKEREKKRDTVMQRRGKKDRSGKESRGRKGEKKTRYKGGRRLLAGAMEISSGLRVGKR